MRPRKIVLLIEPDENELPVMRLVLRNWFYEILSAQTVGQAVDLAIECVMRHRPPAVVVSGLSAARQRKRIGRLAENLPDAKLVSYQRPSLGSAGWIKSHGKFATHGFSMRALREMMRLQAVRKRGPKPAWSEQRINAQRTRTHETRRAA